MEAAEECLTLSDRGPPEPNVEDTKDTVQENEVTNAILSTKKETKEIGEKLFMCKDCGKDFGRINNLKRHMKLHINKEIRAVWNATSKVQYSNDYVAETVVVQPDISLHESLTRKHSVRRNFICVVCGKGFGRNSHLKRHLKLHNSQDTSTETVREETDPGKSLDVNFSEYDPICFINASHDSFNDSVEEPVSEDETVQDPITSSFRDKITQDMIEYHQLEHAGSQEGGHQTGAGLEGFEENPKVNKTLHCKVCNKVFGRISHLKRHKKLHISSDELHYCEFCEKSFSQGSSLKKHINTCHFETNLDGKRFSCNLCDKTFLCNSHLKRHCKLHTGREYHVCDKCGKCFSQACNLKAHIISFHGSHEKLEKIYDCSVCGKRFGRMSHLKRHIKLHIGGPTYDCELCGKKFMQNGNLKAHIRMVHSQERSFKCPICSKMFPQRSNLNTHMRIHTGEKPYVCDICGRAFSQGNQLKSHLRIHSGEKPFSCSICGKRFTNKRGQRKHELAHSLKLPQNTEEEREILKDGDEVLKITRVSEAMKVSEENSSSRKCKEETDEMVKEEPNDDELESNKDSLDSDNDVNNSCSSSSSRSNYITDIQTNRCQVIPLLAVHQIIKDMSNIVPLDYS